MKRGVSMGNKSASSNKLSKKLKKSLKEADKMSKHPEKYKSYHNVDEMLKDILNK